MQNKVQIQVKSHAGSGKSTVVSVIKKALKEEGFDNVEFDGGMDFKGENEFDMHMQNVSKRIDRLNAKDTVVEIKEVQLNRKAII